MRRTRRRARTKEKRRERHCETALAGLAAMTGLALRAATTFLAALALRPCEHMLVNAAARMMFWNELGLEGLRCPSCHAPMLLSADYDDGRSWGYIITPEIDLRAYQEAGYHL